jgi:hypothetical protein
MYLTILSKWNGKVQLEAQAFSSQKCSWTENWGDSSLDREERQHPHGMLDEANEHEDRHPFEWEAMASGSTSLFDLSDLALDFWHMFTGTGQVHVWPTWDIIHQGLQ